MKRILSMVVFAILSMFLLRIEHATAQFDNGEHYVTINGADSLPNAQLVIFEHSAHFPDLEEPEKYADSVRRFLRNGHIVSP